MKQILLAGILVLVTSISFAIPPKPNPPRLVNDFAQVISDDKERALEQVLVAFNDSTSTQITIVTVEDLEGNSPSEFVFDIGNKWGVGQKEFDNGIVILVKPKRSAQERGHAFIATGYGVEGVVPDAIANRIIDEVMIPHFKREDYAGGIIQATQVLMQLTSGEYTASSHPVTASKSKKFPLGTLIPLGIIFILMLWGQINRAKHYSMGRDIPFWTAFWMMSAMDTRHRGRWNDFNSGGGSFGGGSSGFGGFGGGSFGGGGAGGSW